jgi:hypothetical protein
MTGLRGLLKVCEPHWYVARGAYGMRELQFSRLVFGLMDGALLPLQARAQLVSRSQTPGSGRSR